MLQRANSDHEAGTIRHPTDGARLNYKNLTVPRGCRCGILLTTIR